MARGATGVAPAGCGRDARAPSGYIYDRQERGGFDRLTMNGVGVVCRFCWGWRWGCTRKRQRAIGEAQGDIMKENGWKKGSKQVDSVTC